MTQATPKALSKDDIIKATAQDATLQEVMRLISNGQCNNLKPVNGVVPLRFLQMFGMNLPQWIVTLSFVEIEL